MKKFIFFSILFSINTNAAILQVMSYNVENLFDAKHQIVDGKDKNDWTFLPKNHPLKKAACNKETSKSRRHECLKTNWTDELVALKISQIAKVVKAAAVNLPDFLGVEEIKNEAVASRLAQQLGYKKFEITKSPDLRGINVALFYKENKLIKKISRHEHIVLVDYPTRNILEVEFLIKDKFPLTIFVNHWPSLHNPDSWRIKAAEVLVKRTKEIILKNPNQAILAMGDFNTIDENNPHPFKTVLFKDQLFIDVDTIMKDSKAKNKPFGTFYFAPNNQWSTLDHFFINKVLNDSKDLEINKNSYEIFSPDFMQKEIKRKFKNGDEKYQEIIFAPKNFNGRAKNKSNIGYSDHFPILVKLEINDHPKNKSSSTNLD